MDIYPQVLPAKPGDAGLISRILIRSFKAGCAIDHRNSPLLVDAWKRRHSVEQILAWLADTTVRMEVAWLQGKPVGVGMVRDSGEISLCYVLPEFFRRRVGGSLMHSLERRLADFGRARAVLYSTMTGHGFYQHLGYRENGQALRVASVALRPMHKPISVGGGRAVGQAGDAGHQGSDGSDSSDSSDGSHDSRGYHGNHGVLGQRKAGSSARP